MNYRLELLRSSPFIEDLKDVSWRRVAAFSLIVDFGSVFTPFDAPDPKPPEHHSSPHVAKHHAAIGSVAAENST